MMPSEPWMRTNKRAPRRKETHTYVRHCAKYVIMWD